MARPDHNFSSDLRYLVVSMVTGRGKTGAAHAISEQKVASFAGAPSERSIRTWKSHERNSNEESLPPPKRGRPPFLDDGQEYVIGGWAALERHKNRIVTIASLRNFIKVCRLLLSVFARLGD
jgi:hypothetical protein